MPRTGWLAGAAVVLLAACSTSTDSPPAPAPSPAAVHTPCGDDDLRLVVPTELFGAVDGVLDRAGCSHVRVDRLPGVEAVQDPGDLWVADQRWTAGLPEIALVATSPVVLVSRGRACGRTWQEIALSARLRPGDPEQDTAALVTLAMAAGNGPAGPYARAFAQRIHDDPTRGRTVMVERVEDVASHEFGPGGCTIVTEQAEIQDGRAAVVTEPLPATPSLRYRLVAPGATPADAEAVAEVLTSDDAVAALARSRLRGPDGAPLRGGIGPVDTVEGPRRGDFARALAAWRRVSGAESRHD